MTDADAEPAEPVPDAFFHTDGDLLVPTALCRGPWDPGAAHGGPVAAVVGRAVEAFDGDPELFTTRIGLELLRPVPLTPLRVTCTTLRPGRRVRLIGVSIVHEGTEVTRAVALRVRRVPGDVPDDRPDTELPDPPEGKPRHRAINAERVGIMDGLEMRMLAGAFHEPGPASYWFRVHTPLVDDEPITPLTRALMAADFGNGISSVLSIETHLFINPDLTVHLHRLPEGDWVANDAVTRLDPDGGGYSEAALSDRTGRIGRAVQSLYVASR